MANNIFEKILEGKIENFVNNYTYNSKDIFIKNNGELIHPRRIWII